MQLLLDKCMYFRAHCKGENILIANLLLFFSAYITVTLQFSYKIYLKPNYQHMMFIYILYVYYILYILYKLF